MAETRKAKNGFISVVDKKQHPIYQFVCSLKPSDHGRITPTNLHNQYVIWRGNTNRIETIRAFGLFLNRFGLSSKCFKKEGRVYIISIESIKNFIDLYNTKLSII